MSNAEGRRVYIPYFILLTPCILLLFCWIIQGFVAVSFLTSDDETITFCRNWYQKRAPHMYFNIKLAAVNIEGGIAALLFIFIRFIWILCFETCCSNFTFSKLFNCNEIQEMPLEIMMIRVKTQTELNSMNDLEITALSSVAEFKFLSKTKNNEK